MLAYVIIIEYWNRASTEWGDVMDWDVFFVTKFPSASVHDSHMALSKELEILLRTNIAGGRKYQKALTFQNHLKVSLLPLDAFR